MTIDVCNEVNVTKGQCLRPMHHEGRHFWRADMEAALEAPPVPVCPHDLWKVDSRGEGVCVGCNKIMVAAR